VDLFASECSDYQNVQSLKEKLKKDPGFYARCAAILGPHQPGITQPDPSYTGAQETHEKAPTALKQHSKQRPADAPKAPSAPSAPAAPNANDLQGKSKKEIEKARRKAEKLKQQLEDTLGIQLPDLPATPALPQPPASPLPAPTSAGDAQTLLDFLLAP
jgi:hypothetical protein